MEVHRRQTGEVDRTTGGAGRGALQSFRSARARPTCAGTGCVGGFFARLVECLRRLAAPEWAHRSWAGLFRPQTARASLDRPLQNSAALALCLLFTLCLCTVAFAVDIVPPAQVDFKYPPPPTDGQAGYFPIADNGAAKACILFADGAATDEVRAARILRFYIEKSTGVALPMLKETDPLPEGLARIHVGETTVARGVELDLPPVRHGDVELPNVNGFLVKTLDPQTLIVRGANSKATVLGAVGLLKRYLGIRRYWPGEPGGIGDVVPKHETLALPRIEWRDWPYFTSRIMSGLDDRGPKNEIERFVTFADFWRMNYTIPSNESYYRMMKATEHLDEPELFPLINGKRFVPPLDDRGHVVHGWQPCVSNPRVAEIMIQTICETFAAEPERIALNLAVNDGYGDCTCDACRAMDAPGADPLNRIGLCDRYVKFSNTVCEGVAEQFPDKMLAFIAYGSMREPPTTVQLHPMLVPVLCVWGNAFEMWDKWMATGPAHMGIYLYHDDIGFILPKLDIHQSAKRLRYIVGTNMPRHFYQEFYGIYPLDGMVGYVENELLWDPRQDEDDILAEYYQGFWGPAAEAMKAFYDAVEADYQAWLELHGAAHQYGPDASSIQGRMSISQFAVLTPEGADRALASLEAAAQAAAGDAVVLERLGHVRTLFGFTVPGVKMHWAMKRLEALEIAEQPAAEQAVAQARIAVDEALALAAYKADVFEKSPSVAYAGGTDRDSFYTDITPGVVRPEVLAAIGTTFRRVSDYLAQALGNEQAVAWWQKQEAGETRPALLANMEIARFQASGQEPVNLIADPSFEERGAKQAAAPQGDLPPEHTLKGGANVWCSQGCPMSCGITDEDAHTGKYSFKFYKTQRAGVSEGISVKGGEKLLFSIWVKHNDAEGKYTVDVVPRADAMMARISIPVPDKPGEWQKIEIPYTVAPGTKTIRVYLFCNNQAPDAEILVDDFFVGQYPE